MIAGPIFAREVLTTPRRPRHYIVRATYVVLLLVLMWTTWQTLVGFQQVQRLGDIAYFNGILFQILAYTQLTLVLFVAPLYGASAISHEKDRRTFVLLLVTRLYDHEIIVDKFLCGQLQVFTLLLAALPVFFLCTLMGGASPEQIGALHAIMLGASLVSGAAGVLIATWREKTFQAVAMTILVIVLSLLVVEIVAGTLGELPLAGTTVKHWCACVSPYRAIFSVVSLDLTTYGKMLPVVGQPSWGYLAVAALAASTYLTIATMNLRRWNPRGEPLQQREADQGGTDAERQQREERRFRKVWTNPVLWREIMTRAYGTRPIIIKLAYLLVFAILAWGLWLGGDVETTFQGSLASVLAVFLFLVLSLLIINAQAVASITSERDLKSLDLLLVTDVTPREFVYGKILGVMYNVKEMIVAPLLLLAGAAFVEQMIPLYLVYCYVLFGVFVVFAAILGLHAALRYDSTRVSLANSLATMFLLFLGILLCLFLIVISGRFEAQWASFVLFIFLGSIGLWVSLSANAPSNAIAMAAAVLPIATFYSLIALVVGDRTAPFLVGTFVYSLAIASMLVPLVSEFDVATGRTTNDG